MHKYIYWYKSDLESWMRRIKDNTNDKAVKIKVEIEIEIRSWGTQEAKNLRHLSWELELDKYND